LDIKQAGYQSEYQHWGEAIITLIINWLIYKVRGQ